MSVKTKSEIAFTFFILLFFLLPLCLLFYYDKVMMILWCLLVVSIDGIVCLIESEKLFKKEEEQRKLQEKLLAEAEENPVKLIHDPTKLHSWCVEKWNGVRYERVSGWFAKKENAEKVYERLVLK